MTQILETSTPSATDGLAFQLSTARRSQIVVMLLTAVGFALTLRIFYPGILTYDAAFVYSYITPRRVRPGRSSPTATS